MSMHDRIMWLEQTASKMGIRHPSMNVLADLSIKEHPNMLDVQMAQVAFLQSMKALEATKALKPRSRA